MAPTSRPRSPVIAPLYRIFFLSIEPLLAFSGALLSHFHPHKFVTSITPAPVNTSPPLVVTPVIQLLCTNIAALYLLFTINEVIVLRLSNDIKVWRAVIGGMLVSDIGHLYGVYAADPARATEWGKWVMEEWFNVLTLSFGAVVRLGFLAGVGVDV